MLPRRYLAWKLAVEADEADLHNEERQLIHRRKLNIPCRISDTRFVQRCGLTIEGYLYESL